MPRSSAPDPRRASHILESLLEESTRRNEASISVVRLIIGSVALAKYVIPVVLGISRPTLHQTADSAVMLVGIVLSLAVLRLAGRGAPAHLVSSVSIVFDSGFALHFPLLDALYPEPGYLGLLSSQNFALPCLIAACAGLRLSQRLSRLGMVSTSVAFLGALVVEVLVSPWPQPPLPRVVLSLGYFASFALLGSGIARRTRRLAYSAADKAVEAERVRQRLGAYVSEEVAEHVLQTKELALGGRRQSVAVLFSDLRGFTAWSEHQAPERIVAELNDYLDAVVSAIRAEGGVVDKYIGDSVMVVFGVPEPHPDDAARALRAADGMQRALESHNAQRASRGLPPLTQGIGVHYGPAVAGNIGIADHLQYTVVGDTVNLASRLESATKQHGVATLFSAEAVEAARNSGRPFPEVHARGRIQVKGREAEIEVFTLADAEPARAEG